ncbi:strawberry notch-like NTP hydrolase domain-containing protein, partial [Sphingobium yanoikuyae]|uniref:strawberry notch-like NTP hydrolase domain-containing protein n=1 Tax=Sphingobium yanoikuyae TaxID=13690 RepID=UPI000AD7D58A
RFGGRGRCVLSRGASPRPNRDLKATGLYTSRALSFAGVEYDILRHQLTPEQIAIYDTYADAWGILCAAAHKTAYREVAIMRRNVAKARKAAE